MLLWHEDLFTQLFLGHLPSPVTLDVPSTAWPNLPAQAVPALTREPELRDLYRRLCKERGLEVLGWAHLTRQAHVKPSSS